MPGEESHVSHSDKLEEANMEVGRLAIKTAFHLLISQDCICKDACWMCSLTGV